MTGGRRPEVLDTYATALAATGEFSEAARTAGRAAGLAREAHAEGLAREIDSRLRLFQGRRAYIDPGPGFPGSPQ